MTHMPSIGAAEELIRDIRRESGLSQAELARRAGLTRSVMNAYARGRRQPGVDALARIAAAAGLEVTVGRPAEDARLHRAGRILEQVLDLAEALPQRRRSSLQYPPLTALAG
jgi:transcriptional regulator with XRE-family HTH domain